MFLEKDLPLTKISIHDTQSFITETFQRAEYSARLYRRTLNAAFNRAVDWEYITDNPFRKVKLGRPKRSFPIFITESELNSLLNVTENKVLKDLFQTAFYTGMRLGELINLKWSNIDFKNHIINIINDNNFKTKNKKDRVVPINPKLFNILKDKIPKIHLLSNNDIVFRSSKGVKFNADLVCKRFKESVRLVGLNDKIHFHTLRHSFASNLVQKGVSLYVVKELLGHEDISTTQIYSHLNKENLFKAIQLL